MKNEILFSNGNITFQETQNSNLSKKDVFLEVEINQKMYKLSLFKILKNYFCDIQIINAYNADTVSDIIYLFEIFVRQTLTGEKRFYNEDLLNHGVVNFSCIYEKQTNRYFLMCFNIIDNRNDLFTFVINKVVEFDSTHEVILKLPKPALELESF